MSLAGLWTTSALQSMAYGPDTVHKHLLTSLPSSDAKAFIITGNSLVTKTPLVNQVEKILGDRHAGTFSRIGQHAPQATVQEAKALIAKDADITTLISIGGGSPIDAAKSLVGSFAKSASGPRHLGHIAIPTTLSAAECTHIAGTTSTDGVKRTAKDPVFMPSVILYDSSFALHTPHELFLSTGIRALDHAVELQYNSHASEAPCKALCLSAIADLFHYLPKYKADPTNRNVVSKCQLAAFNSLIGMGLNTSPGGLGLSHSLGYELGSPFGIPHGFTSCLTLPKIVRLRIETDHEAATNIARVASILGINGHAGTDEAAHAVADAIEGLIRDLGLQRRLQDWNVSSNDVQGIAKGMNLGDLEDKVHGIIISLL